MTGLELGLGVVLALALFAALLVPYLVKEIGKGKVQLGPRTPPGAGDVSPGTSKIRRLGSRMARPIRTARRRSATLRRSSPRATLRGIFGCSSSVLSQAVGVVAQYEPRVPN